MKSSSMQKILLRFAFRLLSFLIRTWWLLSSKNPPVLNALIEAVYRMKHKVSIRFSLIKCISSKLYPLVL